MIVLLVLIVLVVAVVVGLQRRGAAPRAGIVPPAGAVRVGGSSDLDRWRDAGLLDEAQVRAILEFEAARGAPTAPGAAAGELSPRPASRVPLVAEALGYLGAILAGVGVVLVATHYWDQLATVGQVALTAVASGATYAVGAIVGRSGDPAFGRMRSFVWAASSAAAGACAVVVARGGLGAEEAAQLVLAASVVIAVHSGLLWRLRLRPVQQAIALVAAATAVGAAVAVVAPEGWWGVAVWLVGAAMVGAGLWRRGTDPELTEALGALAMVVGGITVASEWQSGGSLFLAGTALGLGAVALAPVPVGLADRWILGLIGAGACLISVPPTIGFYAQGAGVVVGLVVWAIGLGLLALGLAGKLHLPHVGQALGAATMLLGAGVVAAQLPSVAPALGLLTAIGLLAVGARPGAVLESLVGALGLLIYVPWAVARWFPGESRAPILLVVSGMLILAIAVLIGRMGGRVRRELGAGDGVPPAPA